MDNHRLLSWLPTIRRPEAKLNSNTSSLQKSLVQTQIIILFSYGEPLQAQQILQEPRSSKISLLIQFKFLTNRTKRLAVVELHRDL